MTDTPREVFHRLLDGITHQRWIELPDLYAEDAVVELPFALPRPQRLEGREALRAHFEAAVGQDIRMTATNVVVHETTDPEVIVAEWDYAVDGMGQLANVQILRVRAGRIVATRDFHHHAALAATRS